MGKSIRSKVKKRFRAVKKQRVNMLIDTPRAAENNESLKNIALGIVVEEKKKKNAFLYPDDPDAEFPQKPPVVPLDFRSEALPMSGYATCQNRRRFTPEEKELRTQRMMTIPANEANRLGLMSDAQEMGEIPGIPEMMMEPNMLAGGVIDGVKREAIKPENKKKERKQTKRQVNGKKAHGRK